MFKMLSFELNIICLSVFQREPNKDKGEWKGEFVKNV